MLARNFRGGCWWYDSRGWAFPPISHCGLLLCDRWQQRDSLPEWCLTWKCGWSKGMELNSSTQKKMASTDIHRCLLNVAGEQRVDLCKSKSSLCSHLPWFYGWAHHVLWNIPLATVGHLSWLWPFSAPLHHPKPGHSKKVLKTLCCCTQHWYIHILSAMRLFCPSHLQKEQ